MKAERDYLMQILRKLYSRMIQKRKTIRRAMNQYLFELLHGEKDRQNGAAEILEIYQSIISGYVVPLREEHRQFFSNILVPLHKCHSYPLFQEQLVPCCLIFLVKDKTLAPMLLRSMLKFWPFASSDKEKLFLTEVREVIEVTDPALLKPVITPLFKQIMKCVGGPNMFVSDRALCFFESDHFVEIVKKYRVETYPVMVPLIERLSQDHW